MCLLSDLEHKDLQLHLDHNILILIYALIYVQIFRTTIYMSYKLPWTKSIGYARTSLLKLLFILSLELLDQGILFLFRECIEHENRFVTNVVLNDEEQNEIVRFD